ncbi:MAG: benzoyl-CoA reductase subunit C [Thermoanaerobaculia bacterium]|nr:benzoyl-CoA reductase subunit C [Thermoanaerobaculia bacterium]
MTRTLNELVDDVQALYDDIDLRFVSEWKERNPGGKAIGHMPIWVPRELIHAAGMLPVGITGGGDRLEIIRGDAFFQSYICRIPRSTIEMALSHRLDSLDGMLFPSICDVIRNLSGMWSTLFPDRYVRYVDVPQNFDRKVGGWFWRQEMNQLREDFERIAERKISDDDLRRSIEVYNENRKLIRELYAERSRRPWVYPLSEAYLVMRAGNLLPPEEHSSLLREYLDLAAKEDDRREQDLSRVVLVGMFCEQPPHGLLITLERAGCWVVDDDLLLGMRWLVDDVPTEGDPVDHLVDAYLEHSASTASKYAPEGDRARWLVDSVERNQAEGVVFCAASFCDPALLDQPMLVSALDEQGIPHTEFKFSEDTGQFAVIREQAGTFSDSIRLWSEA